MNGQATMSTEKYIVYDDNKSVMASFDTEARALQFIQNNDDIAAYLNNTRVTPETLSQPYIIDPVPEIPLTQGATPAPPKKLLSAAEAIEAIKKSQEAEVTDIINTVIEQGGVFDFQTPHKYVLESLDELGYYVTSYDDGNTTVSVEPINE